MNSGWEIKIGLPVLNSPFFDHIQYFHRFAVVVRVWVERDVIISLVRLLDIFPRHRFLFNTQGIPKINHEPSLNFCTKSLKINFYVLNVFFKTKNI